MKPINLRIFGTNALIYCIIILSKIDKDHLNIFYLKSWPRIFTCHFYTKNYKEKQKRWFYNGLSSFSRNLYSFSR